VVTLLKVSVKKVEEGKWGLHPLIHTLLEFNLAQDIVYCQCGEEESPHWPQIQGPVRARKEWIGYVHHSIPYPLDTLP